MIKTIYAVNKTSEDLALTDLSVVNGIIPANDKTDLLTYNTVDDIISSIDLLNWINNDAVVLEINLKEYSKEESLVFMTTGELQTPLGTPVKLNVFYGRLEETVVITRKETTFKFDANTCNYNENYIKFDATDESKLVVQEAGFYDISYISGFIMKLSNKIEDNAIGPDILKSYSTGERLISCWVAINGVPKECSASYAMMKSSRYSKYASCSHPGCIFELNTNDVVQLRAVVLQGRSNAYVNNVKGQPIFRIIKG